MFSEYFKYMEVLRLLTAHKTNGIRHTEVHTAEPLASDASSFEFEVLIEIWKVKITRYLSNSSVYEKCEII
jgi:hypothetical protein